MTNNSPAMPHTSTASNTTIEIPEISFEERDDGSYELRIGKDSSLAEAEILKTALGISKRGFLESYLSQVSNATATSEGPVVASVRFALGFVQSVEPQNEVEAALAAQMAAVHIASMDTCRRFAQSQTLQQREVHERAMNKLMRTFTTQMQTLKKYRATVQQVVRVERVTVEDGGQAIVGPVSHGGHSNEES